MTTENTDKGQTPTEADSQGHCALGDGSARYVTDYDQAGGPHWVTRVEHGPYVAYHYIREAADQLTEMLNERTRLRAALVQIEGNDRDWNARWAAIVAAEVLSPNINVQPRGRPLDS